jgi:redox-sensitive bicupin YhaK (pirin superfamily)
MGVTSTIDTVIPITLIHVKMEKDAVLKQKIGADLNGMIYAFRGGVKLLNNPGVRSHPLPLGFGVKQQVNDGELALLSEGDVIEIKCDQAAELLILAGPEINEPIARYGPFVMNTRQEINQAIMDYQNGTLA